MKYHSGPPPSVGWWPTKDLIFENAARWWNGHDWSVWVSEDNHPIRAGICANIKTTMNQEDIKWAHRPASWPERSRT